MNSIYGKFIRLNNITEESNPCQKEREREKFDIFHARPYGQTADLREIPPTRAFGGSFFLYPCVMYSLSTLAATIPLDAIIYTFETQRYKRDFLGEQVKHENENIDNFGQRDRLISSVTLYRTFIKICFVTNIQVQVDIENTTISRYVN